MTRILGWTQRLFLACAAVAFAYCGFVLADAWFLDQRANRELERIANDARNAPGAGPLAGVPAAPELPPAIGPDGLIGRIEIPRLGLSATILDGTDTATLRRAVGHIANTALPGQPGNAGLAGHRDTLFRSLKDIRRGDIIVVAALRGEYRYRVVSTRIVPPTEVSVLNPSATQVLTLVTCYPFYFVGPAPDRFIVRAERVWKAS